MSKPAPTDPIKEFIWNKITYVFPDNCFEELIIRFNIFHEKCPKIVLSRILGLLIVLGSVLVKVPQILKILHAKSGAGISLMSNFLELFAITSFFAYSYSKGFTFSAYGDAVFLSIQTCIVAFLIMWFYQQKFFATIFLTIYLSINAVLLADVIPIHILATSQMINIPISVAARGIQALENYRNQSTGQLSAITVFMQFAGCLARIFTSVQETGDTLMISTFVVASVMNGIIFAQILLYWGRKIPKKIE